MTTLLPKDADNNAIPALRLRDNGAHAIAVTGTSARNTNAFDDDTKVISLYATTPVYIACGDDTVVATTSDHYFPAGVYYDIAISGGSGKGAQNLYVAVLRADTNGTLYISEKE
ncbi:MAG: hypothetical protein GW903_06870 [Alphaproteobacteria bacterium]|nr:hypothetical protein [Alphaproteobacteria bacterium]NCQ88605.1 hypothetical protein [Alphaproteobacteria bacterium]NCT06148.1 hypothetical protein [Alphaproteobacteria bacterium]